MDLLPLALQALTLGAKKTALVMTPLIGLMVLLGTLAFRDSPPGRRPDQGAWLGLAVLVIFLLAHWSSIRRAAR